MATITIDSEFINEKIIEIGDRILKYWESVYASDSDDSCEPNDIAEDALILEKVTGVNIMLEGLKYAFGIFQARKEMRA